MGSAHLGLCEVNLSSSSRSNTPLLDDEAIFLPSEGPAVEEDFFYSILSSVCEHLFPQSFIFPHTLFYFVFELLLTGNIPN